jgi:hypothetical protein
MILMHAIQPTYLTGIKVQLQYCIARTNTLRVFTIQYIMRLSKLRLSYRAYEASRML